MSESGPPHEKVYAYQLTCGELSTTGNGRTKKDAKLKAAEDIVPRLRRAAQHWTRPYQNQSWPDDARNEAAAVAGEDEEAEGGARRLHSGDMFSSTMTRPRS